jgi:hypothetical protein
MCGYIPYLCPNECGGWVMVSGCLICERKMEVNNS